MESLEVLKKSAKTPEQEKKMEYLIERLEAKAELSQKKAEKPSSSQQ